MMDEWVPFGSHAYKLFFVLLLFARSTDFLSTWIATPNLVLEANPIARTLRWKGGIIVNIGLCIGFAFWPLTAVIICTTSVLVAARNFQLAWLMRSSGEENYRTWFGERLEETPIGLFLFCLFAQTMLTAAVGLAVIYFNPWIAAIPGNMGIETKVTLPGTTTWGALVSLGIGMGIIGYALAVLVFTLLSLWRRRRSQGLH